MPQEIALYDYMTLRETFLYFGTLANMIRTDINERSAFLQKQAVLLSSHQLGVSSVVTCLHQIFIFYLANIDIVSEKLRL